MSKKTSKKNRQARREQLEQERKRRNLMIGGGTAVVVLVLIGLIVFRIAANNIEGVFNFGTQERGHDQSVVIEETSLPPVGGIHDPVWLNCGVYETEVPLKNAIHAMEHGAVWITYRPDLAVNDVTELESLVRGQSYMVISPYPNLASNIVLTAWGVQLQVDSVNDERIEKFISVYRNGPQTPEPGASCSGGTGNPIG
ncbi:MAG: DUF3105 domain-containing protein [Candidatus Promineifilaceae bacterium]